MLEADIVSLAIENLEKLTKADLTLVHQKSIAHGYQADALLDMRMGNAKGQFAVEVKKNVLPPTLPSILAKLPKGATFLLIAQYISVPAQQLLKQQEINYLDVAGNCFIQHENGLFLHIKGERLPETFKEIKHKAFNKNGIKLIYALLLNESLINQPYRMIAGTAGISSSTVGSVQEDLAASKYLHALNANQKLISNKRALLEDWVTAFNQMLKPKLLRGKYRFAQGSENWRNLDLGKVAYWGGEPAAALLTNYLQPGIWTLYTNLDRKAIVKDFHLVPDMQHGNVEIYEVFWNEQDDMFVNLSLKTVNPLLVYADLMGSSSSRNFETARRIYEQHLRNMVE